MKRQEDEETAAVSRITESAAQVYIFDFSRVIS
jgi:hypothetical protein